MRARAPIFWTFMKPPINSFVASTRASATTTTALGDLAPMTLHAPVLAKQLAATVALVQLALFKMDGFPVKAHVVCARPHGVVEVA